MGILSSAVANIVNSLHERNEGETADLMSYFSARKQAGTLNWKQLDDEALVFLSEKMVAIDRDKAEFAHLLCRAMKAKRVVEVGTSHGVSTLYLADAVQSNGGGCVIATEIDDAKANIAQANFDRAGIGEVIELRRGDLRDTLKDVVGPIDVVLMDVWTEMARPALEILAPHLRRGAVVLCDNSQSFRSEYEPFFNYVNDPDNGFATLTLPFLGGLEMVVKI